MEKKLTQPKGEGDKEKHKMATNTLKITKKQTQDDRSRRHHKHDGRICHHFMFCSVLWSYRLKKGWGTFYLCVPRGPFFHNLSMITCRGTVYALQCFGHLSSNFFKNSMFLILKTLYYYVYYVHAYSKKASIKKLRVEFF